MRPNTEYTARQADEPQSCSSKQLATTSQVIISAVI